MKPETTKKLLSALLAAGMSQGVLHAQNAFHDSGDLILFFQKPGDSNSVLVSLGSAANLYRGSAAGATADRQALGIVHINSELTTAFGAGWASDTEVYAGLIGCRSSSSGTQVFDGDQTRTLYASRARAAVGVAGNANSTAWDFTLSGAESGGATSAVAFGNIFETNYTTRAAVAPLTVSKVDTYNPFLNVSLGIQSTAYTAFPGGVQQRGSATAFSAFGPISSPEFLLDLYRIAPRIDADTEGEVSGVRRIGSYEGTVAISSSGSVSFITQPFVGAPEIVVENTDTNPATDITDGQTLDFGSVVINTQSPTVNYQIRNSGSVDLTGIVLTPGGTNASEFEVTQPTATTLAPGGTTTFTIAFKPTSSGSKTATIQIASDDSDENPFDLNLTGFCPVPQPEIAVTNASNTNLIDGSAASTQNFGSTNVGVTSAARTFNILNSGNADLTGLSVSVSGTHAADFVITQPASNSLTPNNTTSFTIAFKPKAAGGRSAVVRIANNDGDENPFDITVLGTGVMPAPEIDIQQKPGSSLVDNVTKVSFGTVKASRTSKGKVLTFTIRNLGGANLSNLALSVTGSHKGDFKATALTRTVLTPAGTPTSTATFTVTFKPASKGNRNAVIQVRNNDSNENPFDIKVSGFGS
jgi:Abnormal spindle-like microcephaly-assoc'd, ASPM-SPD-2-Hydin